MVNKKFRGGEFGCLVFREVNDSKWSVKLLRDSTKWLGYHFQGRHDGHQGRKGSPNKSCPHPQTFAMGKCVLKISQNSHFFGRGNPYLQDFQVKCPKFRCFFGWVMWSSISEKERSFGHVWIWCWMFPFYSLQLYSQVVNGGFSINILRSRKGPKIS